ncbi:adhesion G-protein coupled receptor F1-like [Pseudophryne corroboree]|uniref:adhesion G-protein coupled receptor F1-like n=1 Tax=Pseudophryne corroboree TaxID=495146 RepID=UPI003081ABD3
MHGQRAGNTRRMRDTFPALVLCLAMSGSIYCYWHYEKQQAQPSDMQEIGFVKPRVRRQLAKCYVTDAGMACTCADGYKWNITACYSYAPCSNTSSFCSCLLVPDSNIPSCEIPQNTSDKKVTITGSFTLNETFTTDLLDPTTVKYKALESNITLTLLNAYTQSCNPIDVSVLGFSPGSVVASYRMSLFGPLSVMQVITSAALAAQSLRTIISSKLSTKGLASIEPTDLEVKMWDPIKLTCKINETVTAVAWSLIANNITNTIFSDGGNVEVSTDYLPDKTVSILYVSSTDQWWEGELNELADSLSRKKLTLDRATLRPEVFTSIVKTFGQTQVDLFATPSNTQVPTFVSKIWSQGALHSDAMSFPWTELVLPYAFPPPAMLLKGLRKTRCTLDYSKVSSCLGLHVRDTLPRTYVCELYNGSLVHSAKAHVNVTLLPSQIIADPLQKSLTMMDTSQLLLQCCVASDGEAYNVTWTYGNITQAARRGNQTDVKCYTLTPPRPANDINYTCTFTNKAGQRKETSIPVTVIGVIQLHSNEVFFLVGDKYCSINVSCGVSWDVTKAGVSATVSCPLGKSGFLTRHCPADGVWLPVQDNCISPVLQAALMSVQVLENGLGIPQLEVPQLIQQISITNGTFINNTAEVSALVTILETISTVTTAVNSTFGVDVVTSFLTVASNLTDPCYFPLWKSPSSPPASKVLQFVEQFSQLLQVNYGTFEIDVENIYLRGSSYEKGRSGQTYEQTFDKYLGVGVSINQQTISSLLQESDVKIGDLLPGKTEKLNDLQINSLVQSTSIRLSDGRPASSSILMSFRINNTDDRYSQHCVFWDFPEDSWSDVGCTSSMVTNTTNCSCNHLTSFAVLMSINVEYYAIIDEITYVGLAVSILSLCLCVLVEWFVWRTVVRTNISYFRHISLVNIAVSLLCADVCFLSSAFPSVIVEKLISNSITFLNHFFYLALFFWTFAQSVMLLHQLLFLFHHLRKRVFISLSFFVGYFVPLIIAAGTFLYFYPKGRYSHANVCWLNPQSGAIYAFAIPAGSIIVFNLFTLLVVIAKLSRPSVSDASLPEDRDTAKSILKAILVLTPVFGLTWSFGFALLTDLDYLTKQVFTYGFAGMNAFQGFFILLTCITERKVREAIFSKSSSSPTSTTTLASELSSKTSSSIKKEK